MRIIVFSDSHGSASYMRMALFDHPEAEMIIHLGDGERDLDKISELIEGRRVVQVCGNCDFCSSFPANEIVDVAGERIFCSHGHTESVKYGTEGLIKKAKLLGAHIALYGHTHQSVTSYDDGLYIMNPGSIRAGEYGIVDITPSGIMLLKVQV